jgi:hypothetical protein
MDQAIINALKQKRELERRLAEIEQFLRLYQEFSEEPVDQADIETQRDDAADSTPETSKMARVRRPRFGPKAVASVSTGILQDHGVPLTRGELAAELAIRGVALQGTDKESRARYVGTIMWRRSDLFENIEGKGYWLSGVPIPETEQEKRALRARADLLAVVDD